LQALRTARATSAGVATESVAAAKTTKANKTAGPAPSRIIAAAVSVSAGVGLVALMAGARQDIVVQIDPTPAAVLAANADVGIGPALTAGNQISPAAVEVRIVEAATPAERPVPQARVVTQSEGS
jgi:hypothetical protein